MPQQYSLEMKVLEGVRRACSRLNGLLGDMVLEGARGNWEGWCSLQGAGVLNWTGGILRSMWETEEHFGTLWTLQQGVGYCLEPGGYCGRLAGTELLRCIGGAVRG